MTAHLKPMVLGRHLDRDLTEQEALRVTQHCADCPDCAKRLAELRGLSALVRRSDDLTLGSLGSEKSPAPARPRREVQGTTLLLFLQNSPVLRMAALLLFTVAATVGLMQSGLFSAAPGTAIFYNPELPRMAALPLGTISCYEGFAGSGIVSTGCVSVSAYPLESLFARTAVPGSIDLDIGQGND